MPQMSPLNWMYLMMLFTTTFIILNSMNYFSMIYNQNMKFKKKKKSIKWMW
uniref:ATP synthase complex subunit 8 n=1 Tax=Rhagophthalminae sp. GENSP01 TaxID=1205577 RepID=A0A0S2MNT9_9COLE|nr:ATP synthase F0 subunit 8 [Rhagophthalminae sp. GENSP01]